MDGKAVSVHQTKIQQEADSARLSRTPAPKVGELGLKGYRNRLATGQWTLVA